MKKLYILFIGLFLCNLSLLKAQPVIPDSTFNSTGRRVFSLGGTLDFGDNVAVQPDGKILMSGATFIGGYAKLGMVRFNTDGSFDNTFGTNGISTISIGDLQYNGGFEPEIKILPDGKLLICGFYHSVNDGDNMMICKLLANGQLDVSFGTSGIVSLEFLGTGAMPDVANALATDAAGNIYACGSTRTGSLPTTNQIAIAKLLPSGVPDNTFSADGKLLIDLLTGWEFGYGIAVQADNKIIVTGYAGVPADFYAMRLNPDGSYDATYGTNGYTLIDIYGNSVADEAWGMCLGPDEKVYIVGDAYQSSSGEFQTAVVRLTTSGQPDPAFGNNGVATFDFLPGNNEVFKDIIVLPNGQCYVGGSIGTGIEDFAVFKLNSNGTLNTAFNSNGIYTIDVTGAGKDDNGYGMAVQSDGKILLSGNTTFSEAVSEKYSIVRISPDGVVADFTASDNLICEGTQVQFTSNSIGQNLQYEWTFEGGSPASSTAENPIVTYLTAGNFNVKLKINNTSFADSLELADMIQVIAVPLQPSVPTGPDSVCNLDVVTYSIPAVAYAATYTWQLSPQQAGILAPSGTSATFTAAPLWTGTYSIMVKASNECGISIFSSALEGEVFDKPAIFNLSGNGEYCEGSAGAVLTLSSSEVGVNYQLLLENIPFGAPIAGTGAAIEWINLTTTGFYTCQAASATCSLSMAGQIYVTSITVPAQPPAPTGNTQPCSNQPSVYIVPGTPANNAYIWQLTPSSAGELDPSANMVSVYWNQTFSGNATLTVTGENSCGQGEPSEALLIDVQATPNPVISGEQSVCVNDASTYQTPVTGSNTYVWIVSGGIVLSGAGTNEIMVEWTTSGNGYLIVSETSAAGCMMSSQAFPVMVDPCIHIKGGEQIEYSVYPNPFTDWFNIGFGKKLQGENILVIYSSQGDVKKRIELPDNESGIHNIYAGELAAGIYSAVIYSDGKLIGSFRIAKR